MIGVPLKFYRKTTYLLTIPFVTFTLSNAFSQSDSISIYDLDFTQLSKIKIVSASKIEQNRNEIPTSIFVITETDIKENGYNTLEEALSTLPGFQFRDIQGLNCYIFQRGIPNQNNLTLLLIDGVQVNELNSGGFYAGSHFNLANVERIEVIYGPSSVVYGTNAVTGIINIITKNVMDSKKMIKLSLGNYNTYYGDYSYNYQNEAKTFGLLFSGTYKKTDKSDLKGKAGDNNWTENMENFEKDYSFDLKLQTENFTFGTNFLQKQTTTATQWKSVGSIYKDYGTLWNILFVNSYLKYKSIFSENLTFSSILYNRNTTVLDNSIYQVVDTAQIGYYRPNNLIGIENILNFNFDNTITLISGLTFEFEQLSETPSYSYSVSSAVKPPIPTKPGMLSNRLISIFMEPRIVLLENIFLSGGVRFDNSSTYNQVLTPKIGASYLFDKHIFRLSYAEAFRAPKPWDYTDGISNYNLKPEKLSAMEASINLILTQYFNFNLSVYNSIHKNGLVKETLSNGWRWVNREITNTTGTEMMLIYREKRIKTSFSYTFTQSKNEFGNFIPEISKHTANAGITYLLNRYFTLNLRANYIGKRSNPVFITSTGTNIVDPALIFNCAVSLINYNGFSGQIVINNLLNSEYYHTSNRDPERYRQPQRTIIFSIGFAVDS